MAKDANWNFAGGESAKSGGQAWQQMQGTIAELVAKQIAASKASKKSDKKKKKKKK